MPQTKAVSGPVLELIKSLQQKEYLNGFYLVGGTALAMYYNHRVSIDIDLFSNFEFDAQRLLEELQQDYTYQIFNTAENTLKGRIGTINVDIIAHRYTYVEKPKTAEGISLLSIPDIIAMKLNAISVSGQRVKDFIDIYFALTDYKVSDLIGFYKTKYRQENALHVLKSLIYFDDVDLTDWPVIIKKPELTWTVVRNKIENEVLAYLK